MDEGSHTQALVIIGVLLHFDWGEKISAFRHEVGGRRNVNHHQTRLLQDLQIRMLNQVNDLRFSRIRH